PACANPVASHASSPRPELSALPAIGGHPDPGNGFIQALLGSRTKAGQTNPRTDAASARAARLRRRPGRGLSHSRFFEVDTSWPPRPPHIESCWSVVSPRPPDCPSPVHQFVHCI